MIDAKKESPSVCPFIMGESVVYQPTQRGYDSDVMSDRLTQGATYKVKEIQKDEYVVVEGYHHPGGGIYWSEFAAVSEVESA